MECPINDLFFDLRISPSVAMPTLKLFQTGQAAIILFAIRLSTISLYVCSRAMGIANLDEYFEHTSKFSSFPLFSISNRISIHLFTVPNFLDDEESTCVFMTCALGKGTGGEKFMKSIALMAADKTANFYFNQDWSNPLNANDQSKSLQIWQGPYGLSKEYLKLGWIKMVVDYRGPQFINLKSNTNTGDIYLDNRSGRNTVTEIPR